MRCSERFISTIIISIIKLFQWLILLDSFDKYNLTFTEIVLLVTKIFQASKISLKKYKFAYYFRLKIFLI